MRLGVAEYGPTHDLILIGHIGVLPQFFKRVVLADVLLSKLSQELAPAPVRLLAGAVPAWLLSAG